LEPEESATKGFSSGETTPKSSGGGTARLARARARASSCCGPVDMAQNVAQQPSSVYSSRHKTWRKQRAYTQSKASHPNPNCQPHPSTLGCSHGARFAACLAAPLLWPLANCVPAPLERGRSGSGQLRLHALSVAPRPGTYRTAKPHAATRASHSSPVPTGNCSELFSFLNCD
jgi:hypothetical protein